MAEPRSRSAIEREIGRLEAELEALPLPGGADALAAPTFTGQPGCTVTGAAGCTATCPCERG